MRYVDLGKFSPPRKKRNRPVAGKRGVKLVIWALILVVVGYGLYSFLPHLKRAVATIVRGPAMVFSFLRNDPRDLKQNDGRTNILLLGIDKRSSVSYSYLGSKGEEERNGFLSDTIILVSYDHKTGAVDLISIPRDLWIQIPAFGSVGTQSTKINAAYSIGDMFNYPGGGLALSTNIIATILDLPIHYSARVDFQGFEKGIDLVGGIDVYVDEAFDDWEYPREGYENAPLLSDRYEYVHFDQGWQHMDGKSALKYARSRHALGAEGSDFARAKRQQKVILAAKQKALSLSFLDSVPKLKELYTTFGETIEANIDFSDAPLFYKLLKKVVPENAATHVLGAASERDNLLYTPPSSEFGGAWVLVPKSGNWDEVRSYVHAILFEKNTTPPTSEENNQ